ncbi:endonuclease domain-containing protein [Curtobacterium sp. SP.BCo]|uniref:endonuclease domain-containing protein n=1 Tax=Curtobacterium sp. SP.BCo TaxID=3435229 RepID=UPI003F7404DA
MIQPRPLPLALDPAAFLVRDARDHGVGANRLRRGDLFRPTHGVRTTRPTLSPVRAVAMVLRASQYISHTSALAVWGAPLPRGADGGTVHVSTAGTGSLMRRRDVTGHRRRRGARVVDHEGIRVSCPAQAWRESIGLLTVQQSVAVGDHMVRPGGPTTVDELAAAIVPGSHGAAVARDVLDLVRVGAESPMETWLRLAVVGAGFPEPQLQVEVVDPGGNFLGRVDMAWPEHRIALEYDGAHHLERERFERDQRRDNGLTVNDWLVIHATRADAVRPAVLFERLRQAFATRQHARRSV